MVLCQRRHGRRTRVDSWTHLLRTEVIYPLSCAPLPAPGASREGAMVPDQDLLLGLRLSLSREPGLPWGLRLPQALLGQSQAACAVSAQDNYSICVPECTAPISSHTHSPTPFSFPAGQLPTLPSPMPAGERSPVPLGKVPAAVWDGWGAYGLSEP